MSEWPLPTDARRLYRARLRLQINKALRAELHRSKALQPEELALRLNVAVEDVIDWLHGDALLTVNRLADLCAAMEVEPRVVLTPWAEIEKELLACC